jgi:hypothetical protein
MASAPNYRSLCDDKLATGYKSFEQLLHPKIELSKA